MRRRTLLLGCGYTGQRVARILLARGEEVIATTRRPEQLEELRRLGADVRRLELDEPATLEALAASLPGDLRVLHALPVLRDEDVLREHTAEVLAALGDRIARLVYLSSTGVYGTTRAVEAGTPAAPQTERQHLRVRAEEHVRAHPASSIVLRPAAIYGPERGVHAAMRSDRYKLVGSGDNVTSRIHVDDLAALAVAALASDLEGAWPVADDKPAQASEVAAFCAIRLDRGMPPTVNAARVHETQRVTRLVDGSEIRRRLGVDLVYRSYREGIPAALDAEGGDQRAQA